MSTNPTVLLDANARHRKYTGIDKFHAAGYFGERVVAATGESWDLKKYNPGGLILDPCGIGSGSDVHGINTCSVFYQVAPKAKVVLVPMGQYLSTDVSKTYLEFVRDALPAVKEYGITAQWNSFSVDINTITEKMWIDTLSSLPNYKMNFAIGNDSGKEYNHITDIQHILSEYDQIVGIGAYKIMADGEIVPEGFSSVSNTIDFCAPDMIYTNIDATSTSSACSPKTGTSFAVPWFTGMCVLLDDFFIDKTGKPLTRENCYRFWLDHCHDIDDNGIDTKTGYGAVYLPDPSDIDIERYQPTGGDTPIIIPDKKDDITKEDDLMIPDMSAYKPFETTCPREHVSVNVIPHDSIKRLDFVQCAQPKETITSWYKRQEDKPQIVINGGLFSMATGVNILDFIDDGVLNGTKEGYYGLGVLKSDETLLVAGKDTDKDWKDFMPGYPVLVQNGKAIEKFTNATEINYKAARQALGFKSDGSVIIITVDKASGGMKFEDLAALFVSYGAEFAINLDGGGSTRKVIGGQLVNNATEDRAIDNVFAVWLKPEEVLPSTGTYYATEDISMVAAIDSDVLLEHIAKGSMFKVTMSTKWKDNIWCCVTTNQETGFIMVNNNISSEMPMPAMFRMLRNVTETWLSFNDLVIADKVNPDQSYHIIGKAAYVGSTNTYDFTRCDEVTAPPDSLMFLSGYYGDITPKNADDVTVKFPAVYKVNPDTVSSGLNIRDSYPKGSVIATVSPNTELEVLGIEDDGVWARILYDNTAAYCACRYLVYVREYVETSNDEISVDLTFNHAENVKFGVINKDYPEDFLHIGDIVAIVKTTDTTATVLPDAVVGTEPIVVDIADCLVVSESTEVPVTYQSVEKLADKDLIGKPYVDGVEFVLEKGIMTAYENKFDPSGTVSREQLATIIHRTLNTSLL